MAAKFEIILDNPKAVSTQPAAAAKRLRCWKAAFGVGAWAPRASSR